MKCVFPAAVLLATFLSSMPAFSQRLESVEGLQVISSTENRLELEWQVPGLEIDKSAEKGRIDFAKSLINFDGAPVPYREFILGIPDGAKVIASLSGAENTVISGLKLVPIGLPIKDKNGISSQASVDDKIESFFPTNIIQVFPQEYFRDHPIVRVRFYPVSYDGQNREAQLIKKARLSFNFRGGSTQTGVHRIPGKLDAVTSKMILNYEQAKKWTIRKQRQGKPAKVSDGPWFSIPVTENGLYKISRSTLGSAGIDVSSLDPRTIQIFNSGGRPLNTNSLSPVNNPDGQVENAIRVIGEADGNFDSADYILFFGKKLGGWIYSDTENEFVYEHHPYAVTNYYWLTFGNAMGKRMAESNTSSAAAQTQSNYFIDRRHFEEDSYNLLASGSDWYGYRFFGLTQNQSFNYQLNVQESSTESATFRLKLKGGSGVHYGELTVFRYWFTTFLNSSKNPQALFSQRSFTKGEPLLLESTFPANSYLKNGNNKMSLEYTGNNESCNAYIDWVEFYYPADFTATSDQLYFYTTPGNQVSGYTVSGLSRDDVQLFDISDPTDVQVYNPIKSLDGGKLSFNLDLTDGKPRRIMLSSANSPLVRNITALTSFAPTDNLISENSQADLVIITHPSFRSYANEIATLRAEGQEAITSKVVDTRDIYFWFSSGVQDPVAIRNYLRHAYNNWADPAPSYVLMFGDGHYDYRNIALDDTNRVPPFEIDNNYELNSRESDNFYVDINFGLNNSFSNISPDMAVGRLPVESAIDARRIVDKLRAYNENQNRDGWQTVLTFVADDEITSTSTSEWEHQRNTETMATMSQLRKFNKKKIYLSAYPSVPGGFGRVKPEANQAIIDQVNEGTLIINYVGHGSPQQWAHESVLDLNRDLPRIQNAGKLSFWIAATCDWGKYDDPEAASFTEELIWKENSGAVGVISAARLVYSGQNFRFNQAYYQQLFPGGAPSRRLGEALILANFSSINDQKYHLFGDPSMYLADPRSTATITSVSPGPLKALSKVQVSGQILNDSQPWPDFDGGAALIVNDARYDDVNTGGPYNYTLQGPRIFKGEITVENGDFTGQFIVPKSIRYVDNKTGRLTIYAWNENGPGDAIGFVDTLQFNGSVDNLDDDAGPQIDIFFEGQENFNDGDMVQSTSLLIAELSDDNGINLTREVGHSIEIQIDNDKALDISSFFTYYRDRYDNGKLEYHLDGLKAGEHTLSIQAWDNLNNPTTRTVSFKVVTGSAAVLEEVVNYPNPFSDETDFTFQTNQGGEGADVRIKIYTITGRLIKTLDGLIANRGFNYFHWDGKDADGDKIANGVYVYKIILRNGKDQVESTEKLVMLR